jgi:OmpA-OmpF porin, OOP family
MRLAVALALACLTGAAAADGNAASTKVYSLAAVTFEFNSDKLLPASNKALDDASAMLKDEYGGATIEVAGHTDSTGNEDYNKDLSRRRADAVRQYLIQAGVDGNLLTATGYGSSQPVADNHLRGGRAKNRRVELRTSIFPSHPRAGRAGRPEKH